MQQQQQVHVGTQLSQKNRCKSIWRCITLLLSVVTSVFILACFLALIIIYILHQQYTISAMLTHPNVMCHQRSCGCPNSKNVTSFIPRIIGGQAAPPYIYPWMVILTDRHRTDPFCTGFIISSKFILTAAHCLNNRKLDRVQILSKIHDLRNFRGDRHDVDKWIVHSDYRINDTRHLNDIALIQIRNSFSNELQPCCLPEKQSKEYPKAKRKAIISGWGKVTSQPNSRHSPVLQHVVIPIVEYKNSRCQYFIADKARQLCAGYDNLPIDACAGDSGAPLMTIENDGEQDYLAAAGIVSYGNKQCDGSISSGVYTRISFYFDWINSQLTHL